MPGDDTILTLFGGRVNAETFAHAREYFFRIPLGVPFHMFGQAINSVIRSDGSPRLAMASTVADAVVNIILEALFIYPLKIGMTGRRSLPSLDRFSRRRWRSGICSI